MSGKGQSLLAAAARSTLDLQPTEEARPLEGKGLRHCLIFDYESLPEDALFWRRSVAAAIRSGPWKLIRVKDNPAILFNIENDPRETTNVADDNPELVAQLSELRTDCEKEMIAPSWDTGKNWR